MGWGGLNQWSNRSQLNLIQNSLMYSQIMINYTEFCLFVCSFVNSFVHLLALSSPEERISKERISSYSSTGEDEYFKSLIIHVYGVCFLTNFGE